MIAEVLKTMSRSDLQDRLNSMNSGASRWEEPIELDLSTTDGQTKLDQLDSQGRIASVYDAVELIANDLFTVRHPDLMSNTGLREDFIVSVLEQRHEFGRWFYFPWDKSLTRYPNQADHFDLRTARNKNLVSNDEQRRIGSKVVAVYGLSVGRAVAEAVAISGIGRKFILGDFDTISPTNLNRISASMRSVGRTKVDDLACRISEIDPYIEQVHERSGFTTDSIGLLNYHKPDLIIEEVDQLSAKVRLREYARRTNTPLIMATDVGKKSVITKEMYDTNDRTKPFLGKVPYRLYRQIRKESASKAQEREAALRIVGPLNLSTRMVDSAMEIGHGVSGNPQLGRVVLVSAGLAAEAAEEILLGRVKKSGSRGVPISSTWRLRYPDSLIHSLRVWGRLPGYMRGK